LCIIGKDLPTNKSLGTNPYLYFAKIGEFNIHHQQDVRVALALDVRAQGPKALRQQLTTGDNIVDQSDDIVSFTA